MTWWVSWRSNSCAPSQQSLTEAGDTEQWQSFFVAQAGTSAAPVILIGIRLASYLLLVEINR